MKVCHPLVTFTLFVRSTYSFKDTEIFKSLFSSVFYVLSIHYMHFHREIIECIWFYELLYFLLGKKDFLLWPSYGKIVFKIVYWSVSWIRIRNCLAADTPGSNQSWLLQSNIQRSADDFPYLCGVTSRSSTFVTVQMKCTTRHVGIGSVCLIRVVRAVLGQTHSAFHRFISESLFVK